MRGPPPERFFVEFQHTGSPQAMGAVFDLVGSDLLLLAGHLARDGAAAEDLVQETFLRAIENAGQFDRTRPLMPWLVKILVNQARMERRRENRIPSDGCARPAPPPDPVSYLESSELTEALTDTLDKLPEHYRDVLNLRLVHGFEPVQIARTLGRPLGTVKTQLKRGKSLLRASLPAGLGGAIAMAAVGGRGLAAIRRAVFSEAFPGIAIPTVAIGGGLAVKKLLAAVVLIFVCLGIWWMVPEDSPLPENELHTMQLGGDVDFSQTGTGMEPGTEAQVSDPSPSRSPLTTTEFAGEGGLLVTVVTGEPPRPLPHVGVRVEPQVLQPFLYSTEGRTDEEGTVRFEHLASGTFVITSDRGPQDMAEIEAGVISDVRLIVEEGRSIAGLVTLPTGEPVPGAEIVAYRSPRDWSEGYSLALTDAEGRFELSQMPEYEYVGARAKGWEPTRLIRVSGWGGERERLVMGDHAATLRGRVVDPSGNAVVGALVLVGDLEKGFVATGADDKARYELPARRLVTDDQGSFVVSDLASGNTSIWAKASGFGSGNARVDAVAGGTDVVVVTLPKESVLHGTVRNSEGVPAADMNLWVTQLSDPPDQRLRFFSIACTNESTFRVGGLHGSVRVVVFSPRDGQQLQREFDLRNGEVVRWDPVLERRFQLRGRVLDAAGSPVPRWEVRAFEESRPRSETAVSGEGIIGPGLTDPQGRFHLTGLDDKIYTIEVLRGYGWQDPVAVVKGVSPGGPEVLIHLDRAYDPGELLPASATGRLVNPDGEPVRAGSITAWGKGRQGPRAPLLNDGSFDLGPLDPGEYRLEVDSKKFTDPALSFVVKGGERRDLGQIELRPGGILDIRLERRDGERVRDASVQARFSDRSVSFFKTGSDTFRSPPLPAGEVIVKVYANSTFFRLERRTVRTGVTENVVLSGEPGVMRTLVFSKPEGHPRILALHIVVFDSDENVIADAVTEESLQDDTLLGMVFTLPLGSFRYEASTETGLSSEGTIEVDELRMPTSEEWSYTRPLR